METAPDQGLRKNQPTVVSVGFPAAIPGLYDYRIPERLTSKIMPGMPVLVSVRKKELWGIAVRLADHSAHPALKEVLDIRAGQRTVAWRSLVDLYEWIAAYYQCDIGRVFKPLIRKSLLQVTPRALTVYRKVGDDAVDLTPVQRETLERIGRAGGEIGTPGLASRGVLSRATVEALCRKGLLVKESRPLVREACELGANGGTARVTLTGEQTRSLEAMTAALAAPERPFLLHGITGSGKTFVYIELARRALALGKGVIILVPEIALTPQTVGRFREGIGGDIAVIHSNMTEAERRDNLDALVTGRKRLVVGARSAILTPVDNIGLIVVDEEHDGSYKQTETDPRYHARDVAIVRGKMQGALVVLGSATPAVESYYNATAGKYHLLALTGRFGPARLPGVTIVDMNEERRANNWTPLSRLLRERMLRTLDDKRQAILLLNRRGFSVSLICKDCGHTYRCAHCSVNLIYHSADATLKCHQCGWVQAAPDTCPQCRGGHLKYRGLGIQKAEELLREEFPAARILRMDRDSTRSRNAHVSILDAFAAGEADILLGTQMVAKGLDFPGVALVGVLHADVGLGVPDFRASERTFQLLAQVAGRAGRNDSLGEVVIQTCAPHEHAIVSAQTHDYAALFAAEIEQRRMLRYPPFCRLARLVVDGAKETSVRQAAAGIARTIAEQAGDRAAVLGPAPAVLARVGDRFRYSLLVKTPSPAVLGSALSAVRSRYARLSGGMRLVIDVDPVNMM